MTAQYLRGFIAACALLALGCKAPPPAESAAPGEPFPSLTDAQLQEFTAGRDVFTRVFSPEDGLGPSFNEASCVFCHDLPGPGGAGADPVRKATRFADGRCELLTEHGGDMLQTQITPVLRELGYDVEAVPVSATHVGSIAPPPLFGAGLIDAVPEASILERADPEDADGDGISGRTGTAADGRIGRFGWKAGFATLRDFVESAFIGEMGLTTTGFPNEESLGGHALPPESDPVADPEIPAEMVDQLTRYLSMLALPAPDSAALPADSLNAALDVFRRIGCADCHTPEMTTGPNELDALNRRRVKLYSDLLLHDMGPENASVCARGADPSEWRTAPLMGLRHRLKLMHDARAQSIESAIRAHGGEAARARDGFMVLQEPDRSLLLRFLGSL